MFAHLRLFVASHLLFSGSNPGSSAKRQLSPVLAAENEEGDAALPKKQASTSVVGAAGASSVQPTRARRSNNPALTAAYTPDSGRCCYLVGSAIISVCIDLNSGMV